MVSSDLWKVYKKRSKRLLKWMYILCTRSQWSCVEVTCATIFTCNWLDKCMHFLHISDGKSVLFLCSYRVWILPFHIWGTVHAISEFITYEQTPQINVYADVARMTWAPHLVCGFINIHTLCMRAAHDLVSLCISTESPEHSLLCKAISTKISCESPPALHKSHDLFSQRSYLYYND